MSLYHMYVAAFGPPEALIFRGNHLLFTLTLVFLLYPMKPGGGIGWRIADAVFIAASWAFVLHIYLNYEYVTNRIIYIDDLTLLDLRRERHQDAAEEQCHDDDDHRHFDQGETLG